MKKALLIRHIALALLVTSYATELMAADAGSVLFSKGSVAAERVVKRRSRPNEKDPRPGGRGPLFVKQVLPRT